MKNAKRTPRKTTPIRQPTKVPQLATGTSYEKVGKVVLVVVGMIGIGRALRSGIGGCVVVIVIIVPGAGMEVGKKEGDEERRRVVEVEKEEDRRVAEGEEVIRGCGIRV